MMGTYRLVVSETNGSSSFWYNWRLFDGDAIVKQGWTDTRWGARRAARRWIKQAGRKTSWEYELKA